MRTRYSHIVEELKEHVPFTFFGTLTGIIILALSQGMSRDVSEKIFYVLHPVHVLLSALVTSSMYGLHRCGRIKRCPIGILLAVGYLGSIGVATLSDSLIPYVGETLLDMPNKHAHIGFIEKWWLINPLAVLGIAVAYFKPTTKIPHAGHVLLSTWASLFHMKMAVGESLSLISYATIFFFLFVAVWVPCCFSDIIFPLLFVRDEGARDVAGE